MKVDFQKITNALQIKIYDRLKRITKNNFTEKQIIEWAKEYKANDKEGKLPTAQSGEIPGTNETWGGIQSALFFGNRGLKKSTLPELFVKYGLSEKKYDLTEKKIIKWAKAHQRKEGKLPTHRSGKVGETTETWRGIDAALKMGLRGLKAGSSLLKLFIKYELKEEKPDFTEKKIIKLVKAYQRKEGKLPTAQSGEIPGTNGETWNNINHALRGDYRKGKRGRRGLKGGSSLAKFLIKYGFKEEKLDLTVKKIIKWAKAYQRKEGKLPTAQSGEIPGTNETWRRINAALVNGHRGLEGGSSLPKLFKDYKLKNN